MVSSSSFSELEVLFADAVSCSTSSITVKNKKGIPGAIIMAADRRGTFEYAQVFGVRSLDPEYTAATNADDSNSNGNGVKDVKTDICTGPKLTFDSVFALASMTKLMTTVAALQCVERGLIGLDEDVGDILHELKHLDVLERFEEVDGKCFPRLRKANGVITLRLLLSHASGLGYDGTNPMLMKWRESRGESPRWLSGSIDDDYVHPLLFDPGHGFEYGCGIDWAGKLVERLNNMRLEEHMTANIWKPLGMTSTTFRKDQPDLKLRAVDMSLRQGDGSMIHFSDTVYPTSGFAKDDCGGVGAQGTAGDYMKLLLSILRDDGKVLQSVSIDEMFKPQLSNPMGSTQPADKYLETYPIQSHSTSWGLGAIINLEDLATGRKKNSIQWSGMPNLWWWIDREAGLCGVYFSQLIPTDDAVSLELFQEFEKTAYRFKSNQ